MNRTKPAQLPSGWTAVFSKTQRRYYFHHEASNVSTWQQPKEVAAVAAAAQAPKPKPLA